MFQIPLTTGTDQNIKRFLGKPHYLLIGQFSENLRSFFIPALQLLYLGFELSDILELAINRGAPFL